MTHAQSLSRSLVIGAVLAGTMVPAQAADRTFDSGSLVIPMDLSYQSRGMFQAYGLVYQLLRQGIHVHWVIDPNKTWHAARCDMAGDTCAWDCGVEGSSGKCPYPTASPDVTITTKIIWDDNGVVVRDTTLGTHRYRGGPFVIDSADRDAALAIIDIWNDKAKWPTNKWAQRTVFHVVSIHEATAPFTGNVSREMLAAPTIAVFSDGNEKIATGYLRAAGIPQSTGIEFPGANCGATNCGPGTANPDMLTPEQIAGDLGTCGTPNTDHKNGALFKPDGTPAFCQIMSMHWGVAERETVKCGGGNCPATRAACPAATKFTFNGHEVVAEVRAFLAYNTHFFAECQAVNAYENTVPNPNWPFLDDTARNGHFLTTTGIKTCTTTCNGDYDCVVDGCGAGVNCCMPKTGTWQNLPGFEVAAQPDSADIKVLRPDVPYNQFDGAFGTTGGSEPAYNLSTYLPTMYQNNRQVTLLTTQAGPGVSDVWMSGYLDGCNDIILGPGGSNRVAGCEGKISYLGGHAYDTTVPVTSGAESHGTRLFLNALFEAQCTTATTVPPDPDGGDSDGDGVDDGADTDPNDPNKCGDTDGDGCDDCSSGMFNTDNDCDSIGPGSSDGCCDVGASPEGAALLMFGVGLLVLRPRRRARA
jgi:hypothetical protein